MTIPQTILLIVAALVLGVVWGWKASALSVMKARKYGRGYNACERRCQYEPRKDWTSQLFYRTRATPLNLDAFDSPEQAHWWIEVLWQRGGGEDWIPTASERDWFMQRTRREWRDAAIAQVEAWELTAWELTRVGQG